MKTTFRVSQSIPCDAIIIPYMPHPNVYEIVDVFKRELGLGLIYFSDLETHQSLTSINFGEHTMYNFTSLRVNILVLLIKVLV